jgi:hypothetical protein
MSLNQAQKRLLDGLPRLRPHSMAYFLERKRSLRVYTREH